MNFDKLGIKFKAVASLGESTQLIYGKKSGQEIIWSTRDHQYTDGIGGFADVLTEDDHLITSLPSMTRFDQPGFITSLRLMFRFIKNVARNNILWKSTIDWNKVGAPHFACTVAFSLSDSLAIQQHILKEKISSTALFLSQIDSVTKKIFLETGSERKWVIPITLRGPISEILDRRNIVTTIILRFTGNLSSKSFYKDFKDFLNKKWHWGCWLYTKLQTLMGFTLTKYFASKYINDAYGLFSNLGSWPDKYVSEPISHDYLFIPPVVRMTPITVSLIQWNGKYQLSLVLHPCLNVNDTQLLEIVKDCLHNIGKEIKYSQLDPEIDLVDIHKILESN